MLGKVTTFKVVERKKKEEDKQGERNGIWEEIVKSEVEKETWNVRGDNVKWGKKHGMWEEIVWREERDI